MLDRCSNGSPRASAELQHFMADLVSHSLHVQGCCGMLTSGEAGRSSCLADLMPGKRPQLLHQMVVMSGAMRYGSAYLPM